MTGAIRIMFFRALGVMRSTYTTAFAYAGFLAAAGGAFALALEGAEGGTEPLASVWAGAVSPVLPFLAAVLAMDMWGDEIRTGRMDMLLSSPVRERELVAGKFLAAWSATVFGLAMFFVSTACALATFAPDLLSRVSLAGFLPGIAALSIQAALWCAISLAASAFMKSAAASALLSVGLTSAIPRGVWMALLLWSPAGRQEMGTMPLDAHVTDMACGLVSSATVLSYLALTLFSLFLNSKLVARERLVGRGARRLRTSTAFVVVAAAILTVSSTILFHRLDATLDIPVGGAAKANFSARTESILSEVRGEMTVTAFMSRKDARFRSVAQLLRSLAREAESLGGVRLQIRYVDPHWDIGSAERLVRSGAEPDSIVFERGRQRALVPLADGFGERACASAIVRLAMPPQRRTVYWTRGHGETPFDAYGDFGMSDIARELVRDGYRNLPLDLAESAQMPSDCALVVIAGPTHDFSRTELGRIDAYLKTGGRLLVLLGSSEAGGLTPILSEWGIKPSAAAVTGAPTLSGTDVVVSDFSEHPVAAPLRGSQLVLERPVTFSPSAAASESATAIDSIGYSELARALGRSVASAAERGAGSGDDIAIRPTRVIAVGDSSFVSNAQLEARANANQDFFLNCVAYLSGSAAVGEAGTQADRLVSGLDREGRAKLMALTAAAVPGAVLALLALAIAAGRRLG